MNRIAKYGALLLIGAVLVLVGCSDDSNGGGATVIDFSRDFSLIAFDVDGDGDTSYDFDGEAVDDVVNPAGGRILTYDPDGDGEADELDGQVVRLVSGRFAFDEGDGDYSGYVDEINFDSDDAWYLNGTVFIGENDEQTGARSGSTVLAIEAGTMIYGIASQSTPGTLVIDRNGQIDAVGTSSNPIVFSSSNSEGSREPGDWGGIVINGSGSIQGDSAEGEGGTGTYGSTDATAAYTADDSGTLQYVRVEFGGTLFTPDNELNGIAFQGVGSGTTVDHIQVHMNADDGVEFFGGNVAIKYALLTGIQDDNLDYDDGWNGSAQFVIIHQNGSGGNAIEADGDALDVIDPADPVLANFTIIGAADDDGPNFKSAAEGEMYNSIIVNYPTGQTAITEPDSTIEYYGVGIYSADAIASADAPDWATQVGSNGNFYSATESTIVTGLDYSTTAPDYVPASLGGATVQALPANDLAGNTISAGAFLGAIAVGGTDWTDGWTAFPED